MNSSTLVINGVTINKTELLTLINKNQKLLAIKRLREQTKIGLKASKDIVAILEINPGFQGSESIMTSTRIETQDDQDTYRSPRSRKGSHIIETKKSNRKTLILIFILATISIMMYFFLTSQSTTN